MAAGVRTESNKAAFPSDEPNESDWPLHTPPPVLQTQNQTLEAVKDIAFGSTAGILAKYVEYPFDTVKVRLQSQSTCHQNPGCQHGPLDAFAQAWRAPEGPVKNLYRGISAPLFGAAIETSSLFFSYRIAQDLMVATFPSLRSLDNDLGRARLPFPALLVSGGASGAFTSLLLTPIELIKCKMQVPATWSRSGRNAATKQPSPVQLITQIFRSQGILGFWHGQLGTLIRETGGSAAWFGSYEGVKIILEKYDNAASPSVSSESPTAAAAATATASLPTQLLAGAVAGISYNFFFYPADTIKSRMQTEQTTATATTTATTNTTKPNAPPVTAKSSSGQSSFLTTARQLWQESGLRGFYRGCGITVFRAAPSSAIIFAIYEGLRGGFG